MKLPLHLLRAATADPGLPLDRPERAFFEKSFAFSLEDVRIHRTEASLTANRALGSLAFAVDGHICLCPGFDARLGPVYSQVLAHELAHVAQKRQGSRYAFKQPTSAYLEAEADQIASQVIAGERVTRITPDPSPEPRCWGPAGHYWTIYFAAIAAGVPVESALSYAFIAQMPDQVEELDATEAGEDTAPTGMKFASRKKDVSNQAIEDMLRDEAVQKGLHCLTGGDSDTETKRRMRTLKSLNHKGFEFSLALHPFGDSYAHRVVLNEQRLYVFPFGHLVEMRFSDCSNVVKGGGLKNACAENAYAVDNVNRRGLMYPKYASDLYELFQLRWAVKPRIEKEHYDQLVFEIMKETTESAQIKKINEITEDETSIKHDDYDPNEESLAPWDTFRSKHSDLNPMIIDQALRCAAQWSGISFRRNGVVFA